MRRLAIALLATGCFSGDGTLGAVCREDADCGAEQSCANQVCGLCGDGVPDPGEVCFGDAEPLDVGVAVEVLGVVDLDGIGSVDLVATQAGNVVPLLADAGSFVAGAAVPVDGVAALRSGDVDGDGFGDVLARSTAVTVLFGDGAGELAAGPTIGTDVVDAVVDSGRGVIVAATTAVTLHTVQDDRTFVEGAPMEVGGNVQRLLGPAALDGDSLADLVVVLDAGAVAVLAGAVEGYALQGVTGFGELVRNVALLDFTGNGRPDLVGLTGSDSIVVLHGDGQGGFVEGQTVAAEPGADVLGFVDANRDLILDVVGAGPSGGLSLHLTRGRALQPATELSGAGPWQRLLSTRVDADLHSDVLAQHVDGSLFVLRGEP